MKTMIIAAVAALALGAGSAAYAEGDGGGETSTGLAWQAANGNATVPATEWFAANAAQRQMLSHQYAGATYQGNGQG